MPGRPGSSFGITARGLGRGSLAYKADAAAQPYGQLRVGSLAVRAMGRDRVVAVLEILLLGIVLTYAFVFFPIVGARRDLGRGCKCSVDRAARGRRG